MDFMNLLLFTVKRYSIGVVDFLTDPIAWVFILIIFSLYRKTYPLQKVMYGKRPKYRIGELMTTSAIFGLLVGLVGSLIISAIGIAFFDTGSLLIIVVISLLLMVINPRYICFSYSGGIWSLLVLIAVNLIRIGVLNPATPFARFVTDNLSHDISALLSIIAVMHLMEALLIWIDGHRGALPVFTKRGEKVVGAFIMQRYWIVPMILYVILREAGDAGGIATPQWWPIIKPDLAADMLKNAVFLGSAFIVMMGFSSFTVTKDVKKKARRSSVGLLFFSVILLFLSVLSMKYYVFKYIAALFAPLAHEALLLYERYREDKGEPLWQFSEEGIVVLDTMPDTPSETMKIMPGDVVLSINNIRTRSLADADDILKEYPTFIWVELSDSKGKKRTAEYKDYANGIRTLGIITIPKYDYGIPLIK